MAAPGRLLAAAAVSALMPMASVAAGAGEVDGADTGGDAAPAFKDMVTAKGVITTVASLAVGLTAVCLFFAAQPPRAGAKRGAAAAPRWLSSSPGKRWGEQFFLAWSAAWILGFGSIVATGVYEVFTEWHYMAVGLGMALPCALLPLLFPGQGEPETPLLQRYWVKANVWIAIISYVGNYFWTHYFYNLLSARYLFRAHRLNDVPIALFFCTHAYFIFYHTGTTILLRRFWTSAAYTNMPAEGLLGSPLSVRAVASAVYVWLMAVGTAFMETWTISAFPYYTYSSAEYMYTVGSVCYGIYFVVSFPAFYRLDEGVRGRTGRWSVSQAAIDSLGACMLVTIMLDLWRLAVGGVLPNTPKCVPWM